MKGVLTLRNLKVIVARHSGKQKLYAVAGTNKAARQALAKSAPYYAKKLSGDYWLYKEKDLKILAHQINMGIAD
jgi:hypothetical protein